MSVTHTVSDITYHEMLMFTGEMRITFRNDQTLSMI